jgi:hypothetical protein
MSANAENKVAIVSTGIPRLTTLLASPSAGIREHGIAEFNVLRSLGV